MSKPHFFVTPRGKATPSLLNAIIANEFDRVRTSPPLPRAWVIQSAGRGPSGSAPAAPVVRL